MVAASRSSGAAGITAGHDATNAIGRAIGVLGEEWTLLLLREALIGMTRYGDFKASLGISDAVLSDRLQRLVDAGLLTRVVYQRSPSRSGYELTSAGAGTWAILFGIWSWERRWVPDRAVELPEMVHRTCGSPFDAVLGCATCEHDVHLGGLGVAWGPAGGWVRSIPRSTTRRRSGSTRGTAPGGHFPETMTIMGNRWSSAILAAALLDTTRFTDFETRLRIPAALLTERLDEFCTVGVLTRAAREDHASRVDYVLTDKGRAFLPIVLTLVAWAHRWMPDDDGAAIELRHAACGREIVPRWRCGACGETLRPNEIDVVPSRSPVSPTRPSSSVGRDVR